MDNFKSRINIIVICCLIAEVFCIFYVLPNSIQVIAPYQIGSYDFHAYYRSFKAMLAGQNPYNINNSKMLYFNLAQPVAGLKYFNPPWG